MCIWCLQICEVILSISNGTGAGSHKVSAKLNTDGNREFKINNVKRALKDVKVQLPSRLLHQLSSSSKGSWTACLAGNTNLQGFQANLPVHACMRN